MLMLQQKKIYRSLSLYHCIFFLHSLHGYIKACMKLDVENFWQRKSNKKIRNLELINQLSIIKLENVCMGYKVIF